MIGRAIRIIRQAKGLSRSDTAKGAQIAIAFMSLIESEDRSPSLKTIEKLAGVLDVPFSALLHFSTVNPLMVLNDRSVTIIEHVMEIIRAEDALKELLQHDRVRE